MTLAPRTRTGREDVGGSGGGGGGGGGDGGGDGDLHVAAARRVIRDCRCLPPFHGKEAAAAAAAAAAAEEEEEEEEEGGQDVELSSCHGTGITCARSVWRRRRRRTTTSRRRECSGGGGGGWSSRAETRPFPDKAFFFASR